jgi:hypothetical protein
MGSTRMKKLVLFIGLILLTCALVPIGSALLVTNPLAKVAEDYFLLISQDKVSEAYQMTSSDLQAEMSLRDFRDINRGSPLEEFVSVSWDYKGMEGNWGELQGMLETGDASYPEIFLFVNVELVQENREWKIHDVELW